MFGLDDRPPLYIPAHILERETRNGLVLFDAKTGRLFRLDASGARIWRLIEGHGHSLEALARVVSDQHREPIGRIARDVRTVWSESSTAFQRLSVTAQMLKQSSLGLDLAQGRYNLGLSSIVELTQAQLSVTQAQIEDLSAKYDYQSQYAALQYTMGLLR